MDNHQHAFDSDEKNFSALLQGVTDLQSLACDIGMERQDTKSCKKEEQDQSTNNSEEDSLKIIKQTSDITRLAMILIKRGLQMCAFHASRKSKFCNSLSSAISFIREEGCLYQAPKHLLLQWERNMILIDLFTTEEGLYCNKRIAQDMFDICMETFDWLRSLDNNNK
jgi:hypothetical protein